jgi:preprotein translocase subunit SecD
MRICSHGFNLYLMAVLVCGLVGGCKTADGKDKKILSTLRLHLESKADPMGRSETADVYRQSPVQFTIDKAPFLSEAQVKEAKVIDVTGGFALQVQFDRQGSWLLEQYTAANRTKHILVFSQFVGPLEEKLNKGRWLAAPQINNHITDGLFAFTPDATREEAERIALGLNNVAKRLATGKEVKF